MFQIFLQNVPCFARKKFHAITENATTLHVETEDKEYYTFQVRNGSYKTRIYGGDYPKFLINYDMKAGDTININMENPDHFGFVKLYPYDKYGFKKERVEGYFLLIIYVFFVDLFFFSWLSYVSLLIWLINPFSFFAEEFDFLEDAERVVVSKGVDLTYTQISKINHHIVENGVGLGVVFIHRLTPSDINKNQMVMSLKAFHYMLLLQCFPFQIFISFMLTFPLIFCLFCSTFQNLLQTS
jgi:hypothetical protein